MEQESLHTPTSSLDLPLYSDDKLRLYLTESSIHNTIIRGAGYTYQAITPPYGVEPRITQLYRLTEGKNHHQQRELVGEIHWGVVRAPFVRMARDELPGYHDREWIPFKDFLRRKGDGDRFDCARSFEGENGQRLQWELRKGQLVVCSEEEAETVEHATPLAVFKQNSLNVLSSVARHGYLEILPQLADSLNSLIITFLIMERRRRNMLEAVHWNIEDDDDRAV